MRIEDLRYDLGPENIAGEPPDVRLGRRDLGRMLVVNRRQGILEDDFIIGLPERLARNDVVVLNNSKRIPGILNARTEEGGQVELRFTRIENKHQGVCRPYPAHLVHQGVWLNIGRHRLRVTKWPLRPHGLCIVETNSDLKAVLRRKGLPITSFFSGRYWDLQSYNPVYASVEGGVESPMAGVHFTTQLIEDLRRRGVKVHFVTLHPVGSWLPFLEENVEDHRLENEEYVVPQRTARALNAAKHAGAQIIAVGSTVMRTIESATNASGEVQSGPGVAKLYITPGYKFRTATAYFTNFHNSRSSLMVLDASFCDRPLLLHAYNEARQRRYLFQEFGDAIFYQ
jgi:S-adenosylmethionine:tRNA ribosyltransferase-isomerase